MVTIYLLFSTGLNSAQLTPLERRVSFTDDTSNDSFQIIERIRHHLIELRPRNGEPAIVSGDQVHGNTVDLNITT